MLTEEGPSKAMTMKGVPVPASAFINDATATMSSVRPHLLRQKELSIACQREVACLAVDEGPALKDVAEEKEILLYRLVSSP